MMLVLGGFATLAQAKHARTSGLGYAAPQWRNSSTLDAIRRLDPDRRMYSNGWDVVLLYTGRRATLVPAKRSAIMDSENPRLEHELGKMRDDLRDRGAVLVLFRHVGRSNLLGERELTGRLNLRLLASFDDGTLYEWDSR